MDNVSDVYNKTMLISVLEQQSRQLEEERNALITEKAELQLEIEEHKETIGKIAVKVKENDMCHLEEINEYDEYVEKMEEEFCQMQVRMEAMEGYIEDLTE